MIVEILEVINAGTLFLLLVQRVGTGDLHLEHVAFDHRPFWHWFAATRLPTIGHLRGKFVRVTGEMWDQTISLPYDTPEEAEAA